MDADCYVAETMIRSRQAEVEANARFAALLRQSRERSPRSKGIRRRLIDLGRSLVNDLRKEFPKAHARCVGRRDGLRES